MSTTVQALAVAQRRMRETPPSPNSFPPSSPAIPLDPRIISGSIGSIVSSFVTTPFEVAKVKLQQQAANNGQLFVFRSRIDPTVVVCQQPPTGPFSMLRHVVARQGVQGAFAGLAPTMMMSVPNCLLYLISYDEITRVLKKTELTSSRLSETSITLAGGASARLIASAVTAPLELLRTRNAATRSHTNGKGACGMTTRRHQRLQQPSSSDPSMRRVFSELASIVRKDGVSGLYRGVTPQLARDVPFATFYMLFLERFREMTKPATASNSLERSPSTEVGLEFSNAALAGVLASTLTTPADVIKSRTQIHVDSSSTSKRPQQSMFQVARSIVQKEGMRGLWKGNQARVLKVAPQYGIMISCYEVGKTLLD